MMQNTSYTFFFLSAAHMDKRNSWTPQYHASIVIIVIIIVCTVNVNGNNFTCY